MQNRSLSLVFLVTLLMLTGCSEPPLPPQTANDRAPADIDTQRYMLSSNLLARLDNAPRMLVFDVRARTSFQDSHIRGAFNMPYGQFEQPDVVALGDVTPDTHIVTYCGCPHHLAGLAADQLIAWGYNKVRVLYEGFWYWRDRGYPVDGLQAVSITTLRFAGRIAPDDRPLTGTDVFIRHVRNGQLEAVATDASGRFETDFHVLDFRAEDRFDVLVGSLEASVSTSLQAAPGRLNRIPGS